MKAFFSRSIKDITMKAGGLFEVTLSLPTFMGVMKDESRTFNLIYRSIFFVSDNQVVLFLFHSPAEHAKQISVRQPTQIASIEIIHICF